MRYKLNPHGSPAIFEHLASSHISQTSSCCRHILAYIVTPLTNITKVLFNKTSPPPCTGSRKRKTITQQNNLLSLWFRKVQTLYWLTAIVFHHRPDPPLQFLLLLNVLCFVNSTVVCVFYFLFLFPVGDLYHNYNCCVFNGEQWGCNILRLLVCLNIHWTGLVTYHHTSLFSFIICSQCRLGL